MIEGLNTLFYPKTIAIVGVSTRNTSVGREILKNLIEFDFEGRIYPVHPTAFSINSLRCYESISAIPEEQLDLLIIVVPSPHVKKIMEEAAQLHVKSTVIITAGFREIGLKGKELELEILEIAENANIRVIGPNCMGILNAHYPHLNATFAPDQPRIGRIGFISQSGALGVVVIKHARGLNLGFSKFVSLGNKMDVNENDMLTYLSQDKDTKIILAYLESFSAPWDFAKIAAEASKKKPILMLKSGRTTAGAKAASSHTGALAGKEAIVSAALSSAGVLRVDSVAELFDSAMAFLHCELPEGRNIAILTNAGGPGTLATDTLVFYDLKLAELSDTTKEKLTKVIPKEASNQNPVDLIASANAERYIASLEILLEDENVHSVIVIFVPPLMTKTVEIATGINRVIETTQSKKPIIGVFMGREQFIIEQIDLKFPVYEFPEAAVRVLKDLYTYKCWLETPKIPAPDVSIPPENYQKARIIIKTAVQSKIKTLSQEDTIQFLSAYGFVFPQSKIVYSLEDLIPATKEIKFPVVLKLATQSISHKSEYGGVFLDIRGIDELLSVWDKLMHIYDKESIPKNQRGVLIQKYYSSGVEIALGTTFDPQFGPVIMIGSGGILIEVLKDINFRLVPLSISDPDEMVAQLRGYPLLLGYRGNLPVCINRLKEAIIRLNKLVIENPEICELDINPLLSLPIGEEPIVLDAQIDVLCEQNTKF